MKFVGFVHAADERSAEDAAAAEYKVPDTLRNKLVARRDDL
jgi:hypothetical protein